MSNIFEIWLNGNRAVNATIADVATSVAEWSDDMITPYGTSILVNATIIDRGAAAAKIFLERNPRTAPYAKAVPYAKEFAKIGFAMVARGKPFSDALADRTLSNSLNVFIDKSHMAELKQAMKLTIKSIFDLAISMATVGSQPVRGLKLEFQVNGQMQVHDISATVDEFHELGESVLRDYPNATIIRFWTDDLLGTGRDWLFLEYNNGQWGDFRNPPK
ncbi:hypothetical protein [Aeoliella sp.]|uniref:hypothetical protein n=1 Tax=Aeoliella sp. TaxID=2795800 RepID=UPI003CCC3507